MRNKIILFIGIVVSILFALFLSNYISNRNFIREYLKGIYELSDGDILSFTEPSIAPYNRGDVFYNKGMLEEAEAEYKEALDKNISDEKECSIRINLALSIAMNIDRDKITLENLDETINRLEEAKGYLLENGWAHDEDENGRDKDAQQLKDDIDKFIEELRKMPEQQQGQGQNNNQNQNQNNGDDKDKNDDKQQNQNPDQGDDKDKNDGQPKEKTQEEKDKEKIDDLQQQSEQERKQDMIPDEEDPKRRGSQYDKVW